MQDLLSVLLDWRVILLSLVLLLIFPLVFFLSSLDKKPIKIKRVRMKRKDTPKPHGERRKGDYSEDDEKDDDNHKS